MGGDPFGMLLRQRIIFLGGEVSCGFLHTHFSVHSLAHLAHAHLE